MKKIEKKVNRSFTNATPDVLDKVKENCNTAQYSSVSARAKRPQNLMWKVATCALAFVLIAVLVVGSVGLYGEYASAATVSLDVNPSIEIKLNNKQKVVSVTPLNTDGEIILGTMDLRGSNLDVVINALIGSMLRNGYLSDLSNSVLVSVDSSKSVYDSIVQKVTDEITVMLSDNQISASVLTQWIQSNDAVNALAKQYGISVGKAQLIHNIASKSTLYTEEQLVSLTVNELGIILGNLNITDGNLSQSGSSSEKSYIGSDAALAIALNKLGMDGLTATSEGLWVKENKLDFDDGVMVYEVEFVYGKGCYEAKIGAISGQLVSFECSLNDDYTPGANATKLTQQQIENVALANANVPSDSAVEVTSKLCGYFRIEAYNVWFEYGDYCYNYEIDVYGNILSSYSRKLMASEADQYLKRSDVESYFLANNTDGFSSLTDLYRLRVQCKNLTETSTDGDGNTVTTQKFVYQLSFVNGDVQYVYEIDALDKTIRLVSSEEYTDVVDDAYQQAYPNGGQWHKWEDLWNSWHGHGDGPEFGSEFGGQHNGGGNGQGGSQGSNRLTQEEVKSIVFQYAGVNEADVTRLQMEFEQEHGMCYYDVEFRCGNYEYEVEVNANTGSIIKFEKEFDR